MTGADIGTITEIDIGTATDMGSYILRYRYNYRCRYRYITNIVIDIVIGRYRYNYRQRCKYNYRCRYSYRDQIANIHWITEKAEFQENVYFCFIDYAKAFHCVDHHKLWKILKEMGIPDHLTCLLRNLYAGEEAPVRTGHGTTDWFQIGKRVRQGCILSPCLFTLHAEYIMRNAGLDEAQAGIKIAGRNLNNLRYADDTTLMVESEEELKSLLMKVKEESGEVGLKLNIQKTKIMASGPITSWQIDGETVETVSEFIFLGSKITADGDCNHEIKRCLLLGRKVMTKSLVLSTWTARRSNQFILKEISTEYSLKGLMLKLKLQYFGHLM